MAAGGLDLSSLMGMFGGGGGGGDLFTQLLTGGLFGFGELGNIMESIKRSQYQSFVMNLLKNPGQLGALINSNTQPLSQALVKGVTNQVQGDVASRGLAQSPGIFATTESQALAPYVQQNQNAATQVVMQMLGLPASTFQQPQNMSGALNMFLRQFQRPQSNMAPTGLTATVDNGIDTSGLTGDIGSLFSGAGA